MLFYLQMRAGRAAAATCPACHVQMVYLADVPAVSSRTRRERSLAALLFGDEGAALYRCPRWATASRSSTSAGARCPDCADWSDGVEIEY